MSKILISQSNYIPWKGYFDSIAKADVFVLYDDMQYTKRDWRNRNLVKTAQGLKWLSIPVDVKGKYHQKINEAQIVGSEWKDNHLNTIKHNYSKAEYYEETLNWLESVFDTIPGDRLSDVNRHFIQAILDKLEIVTELVDSRKFKFDGDRTEKLVKICADLKATVYLTGPAAKNYMDESLFLDESIAIEYLDYSGYEEYPQLYPPFEHGVSILDLLFNTGSKAKQYLKYIV